MAAAGPAKIQCPSCRREYAWKPALAGRKLKCKCGSEFTAPAEAPGAEDEDAWNPLADVSGIADKEADELAAPPPPPRSSAAPPPAGRRKCPTCGAAVGPSAAICISCGTNLATGKAPAASRESSSAPILHRRGGRRHIDPGEIHPRAMKMVAYGIQMVFIGVVLLIGLPAMVLVGGISGAALLTHPYMLLAISLLALLLLVVGPFLCLAVPRGSEAEIFIYICVGFHAINLLSIILPFLTTTPQWLGGIGSIASLVATTMFIVFLRRLAFYLREDAMADEANDVLMSCIGLILAFVALMVIPFCLTGLLLLGTAIYFIVKYTSLLHGMSAVTSKYT